jgi:hypothetical protein
MSLAARGGRREKIGTGRPRVFSRPGMARAWRGYPPGPRQGMNSWEVKAVRHPVVGYLVWALLFGALFAWEGLSLARVGSLPTSATSSG